MRRQAKAAKVEAPVAHVCSEALVETLGLQECQVAPVSKTSYMRCPPDQQLLQLKAETDLPSLVELDGYHFFNVLMGSSGGVDGLQGSDWVSADQCTTWPCACSAIMDSDAFDTDKYYDNYHKTTGLHRPMSLKN